MFVTNADIDHLAGLLTLREQQSFKIFGSRSTLAEVAGASVFGVLNKDLVETHPVDLESTVDTGIGLKVTAFPVPGKVALYLEGDTVDVGAEGESTVGLEISDGLKKFFYVPGCSDINDRVAKRLARRRPVILRRHDLHRRRDGRTWPVAEDRPSDGPCRDEREKGRLAVAGAIRRTAKSARKIYTHINNTNPVLIEDSKERASVEKAGWDVAFDGMEVVL